MFYTNNVEELKKAGFEIIVDTVNLYTTVKHAQQFGYERNNVIHLSHRAHHRRDDPNPDFSQVVLIAGQHPDKLPFHILNTAMFGQIKNFIDRRKQLERSYEIVTSLLDAEMDACNKGLLALHPELVSDIVIDEG